MKFKEGKEYTRAQLTESGLEFFRLTNKREKHRGIQYKTGLNEDSVMFNPSGECKPGGMYFFSKRQLKKFWVFADDVHWIRKVTFPDDARVYAEEGKFKANKFILGERKTIPRKMWIRAIRAGVSLGHVPYKFRDRKVCLAAVQTNGLALYKVPRRHRNRKMCLVAVLQDGRALNDVPKELVDRDMCFAAVQADGEVLEYVPNEIRDRDVCLLAVRQNGWTLRYVPYKLRDREMCFAAISNCSGKCVVDYIPQKLIVELFNEVMGDERRSLCED